MTQLQECKDRLANLKDNLSMEECATPYSIYAHDLRQTIIMVQAQVKQLEYGKDNPIVQVS